MGNWLCNGLDADAIEIRERTGRGVADGGNSRTFIEHFAENYEDLAPIIEALERDHPE